MIINTRNASIEKQRLSLPALLHEQDIVAELLEHDVVLVVGETGSGKSTQVPQFILESSLVKDGETGPSIVVCQPRRIAAIALCDRLREELCDPKLVGYKIRHKSSFDEENCQIKFVTEGILLKEIQADFLLKKYTVVIIDEAHERSISCDILLGLLSMTLRVRQNMPNMKPLKLVIMSATLDVKEFTENQALFKNPPGLVKIEARTYPVSIHYEKKTPPDCIEAARKKVIQIHKKCPSGSILLFVAGKKEVHNLCNLFTKWNLKSRRMHEKRTKDAESKDFPKLLEPIPLYASATISSQRKALNESMSKKEKTGNNRRQVFVSTNVAETSLTLPNVKYVVDTGKEKTRRYLRNSGASYFSVGWISQASGNQRAGRAGRTGPGHCYRLYSTAVFGHLFKPQREVEILNASLESTLLFIASLGVPRVDRFPFITSPKPESLRTAREALKAIGALEVLDDSSNSTEKCTDLGKRLALFPLPARLSKFLLTALFRHKKMMGETSTDPSKNSSVDFYTATIFLTAILAVEEIHLVQGPHEGLLTDKVEQQPAVLKQEKNFHNDLDLLLFYATGFVSSPDRKQFCLQNQLSFKSMMEVRSVATQLLRVCAKKLPDYQSFDLSNQVLTKSIPRLSAKDKLILHEAFLGSMLDRLAVLENPQKGAYKCGEAKSLPVYIHPMSPVSKLRPRPTFICYSSLIASSSQGDVGNSQCQPGTLKFTMRNCLAVDEVMISSFCDSSKVFELRKIFNVPCPRYDAKLDGVVGVAQHSYRPLNILLQPTKRLLDKNQDVSYNAFARAFCEGKVFPFTHKIQYRVGANSLKFGLGGGLGENVFNDPLTLNFVNALKKKNCASKQQLCKIWQSKTDSKMFLFKEYVQLLRTPSYTQLQELHTMWMNLGKNV